MNTIQSIYLKKKKKQNLPNEVDTTDTTIEDNTIKNYYSNAVSKGNTIKNTDEYKTIAQQNLSAQTQLGQANALANKYASTTAQSQGLSTQGALQQSQANLQGMYMNALAQQNQQMNNNLSALQNNASNQAELSFTNELANLVNNNELTQENLNELQKLYYGRMSQDAIDRVNYDVNKMIKNYNPSAKIGNVLAGGNAIDLNKGLSKTQIQEIFGEDIANQSFAKEFLNKGSRASIALAKFALDLSNNPSKLEGRYINMNYGLGSKKIYYVKNGKLYQVSGTPEGTNVINIKDLY